MIIETIPGVKSKVDDENILGSVRYLIVCFFQRTEDFLLCNEGSYPQSTGLIMLL